MTDFTPPGAGPYGAVPACPDCGAALDRWQSARCPECRLPLSGPAAGNLWQVDLRLRGLEEQRLSLLRLRADLLAELRARRDEPDPVWPAPPGRGPAEVSGLSAQSALLVLGGVLLSIAALVFTVVSWGSLGIGGRAAVLLAVTVCALAAPLPLRRRGLSATGEAFAAVGLALVLLDCYAMRAAGLAGLDGVDGLRYWALATALVAAGSAAYGLTLRMRVPLTAGFLLGLLPGLLAAWTGGKGPVTVAMVATTAVYYALLRPVADREEWRERFRLDGTLTIAAAIAALWGVSAGTVALGASLNAVLNPSPAPAPGPLAAIAWAWPALGGLALVALAMARPHPRLGYPGVGPDGRRLSAGTAGVALLSATGATLALLLPTGWAAVGYALPAALLAVAMGAALRGDRAGREIPVGVLVVSGAVLLLSSAGPLRELLPALVEPLTHLRSAWADGLAPGWAWQVPVAGLCVLWLLVAVAAALQALGAAALGAAALATPWVGRAMAVATVPAIALLPMVLGLPYAFAVGTVAVLAVVAAAHTALRRPTAAVKAALATATALALAWGLADRSATIAILAAVAVTAAALLVRGAVPAVAAGSAVLALGAEAAAVGATAGLALPDIMLGVLAVAVATVPVASRISGPTRPTPVSLTVEYSGYGLATVALLLAAGQPGRLAFDLTVAGTAALGVALRADRRRAASVAAFALLIAASWIRLALWDVHTPEAYTLTVAAAALVLGRRHRRRFPATDSWAAYGPGLAVGLLPSLLAVWTDAHWLRPLLLGCAALLVTVLGVRSRLQCPLVLGGATLLLVGGHELAPTVVQVLGLLPRWAPLAAAGLLLLALGATYEQRLRDARRVRAALRRLG